MSESAVADATPSAPSAAPGPSATSATSAGRSGLFAGLTRNVVVLGAVSFFTDMSSEMIAPLRMVFLVLVLQTPLPLAGFVEGVAETTASLLKIVSGWLADRVAPRKPLILFGYGLSNAVKPLMALAAGWPHVLGVVFLDRVGKGTRGSPRDALLADATPAPYRGKAFGFHRAMDTFGAACGPLLALWLISRSPEQDQQTLAALRPVFAWTAVPGVLSVLVLLLFLKERPRRHAAPAARVSTAAGAVSPRPETRNSKLVTANSLGGPFWLFTAVATLFALGNSSDAFLFLRTMSVDFWLEGLPLVYFGYNVVYALLATPAGALSDRLGRVPVLVAGYGAFALVYLGWAVAETRWHVFLLFLLYGVYAAATEGVAKALVVDLVPRAQRGMALGWFNGLTGFAALPANLLAGWVWSAHGPSATFEVSAALAFVSTVLLALSEARLRTQAGRLALLGAA